MSAPYSAAILNSVVPLFRYREADSEAPADAVSQGKFRSRSLQLLIEEADRLLSKPAAAVNIRPTRRESRSSSSNDLSGFGCPA